MASEIVSKLTRDLYILEDENNPAGSKLNTIYPTTTIDQVFDDTSPTNKTLRTILAELKQEIINAGRGDIIFPVTSVNGYTEDVILTKNDFGLENVDNTRDEEKPLSSPQREAVMDILNHYTFEVDFSDLYRHIQDSNNPHGVTIEQLNTSGQVTNFINALISQHNTSISDSTHRDIRESIFRIKEDVSEISLNVEQRISQTLSVLESHYSDSNAHTDLFNQKENKSNKSSIINDEADHVRYPTTRAVVEFVANKLVEFHNELPDVQQWIDDILIIDKREDLPRANVKSFRKAYFIRYGLYNQVEIAICRMNQDRATYSWDISSFGIYSKFNPTHFIDSEEGLSVNTDTIAHILMTDGEVANDIRETLSAIVPEIMDDYYTKEDIDNMKLVANIQIVPGTQDGTIRYYINNDETKISEDVHVAGLQRLAFLEYITENEIADQAVHSRHILNRAVEFRHMADKAVAANNMRASYRTVFGNMDDSEGNTVHEISLEYLAQLLDPWFSVTLNNVDMLSMTDELIEKHVRETYHKIVGWKIPGSRVDFKINDATELKVTYDESDDKPQLTVDADGNLLLEDDGSPMAEDLKKYSFELTPDGNLWMTYSGA